MTPGTTGSTTRDAWFAPRPIWICVPAGSSSTSNFQLGRLPPGVSMITRIFDPAWKVFPGPARVSTGRHLVRAATVPGEQVLGPFDDDIVAERGAEHVQLRPAEVLARRGRDADRTMVFDEHEVTVVVLDHLGEVALVGADARQRFDARRATSPVSGSPGDTPRAGSPHAASITAASPSSPSARRTASSRSTVRSSWWSGNRSRARSVSAHTCAGRPRPAGGRVAAVTSPFVASASRCWRTAASVSPSAAASSPGVDSARLSRSTMRRLVSPSSRVRPIGLAGRT